jgi:hypothetical protein
MKAFAFSGQLNLEDDFIEGLRRVATFKVTMYVPYFLTASIGSDAAINDLEFFRKLHVYKEVDKDLAETSFVVLGRHTWYLQVKQTLKHLHSF